MAPMANRPNPPLASTSASTPTSTLPAWRHHCAACGKALTALERYGGGLCHDWRCRHRRTDAHHAEAFHQRQRDARDAAAAQHPAISESLKQAPVVTVRLYDVGLAPVPEAQRQALKDHLVALRPAVQALAEAEAERAEREEGASGAEGVAVLAAMDDLARGELTEDADVHAADGPSASSSSSSSAPVSASAAPPPSHEAAVSTASAVNALLGQVCAACTGHCCRLGQSRHAFIDAATLAAAWREARATDPEASLDAVEQRYLDAVASQHHQGSCAFHGPAGCTLPRARRAAICNDFECPTLEATRQWAEQKGVDRVFLVRHDRDAGWSGRTLTGFVPPVG